MQWEYSYYQWSQPAGAAPEPPIAQLNEYGVRGLEIINVAATPIVTYKTLTRTLGGTEGDPASYTSHIVYVALMKRSRPS